MNLRRRPPTDLQSVPFDHSGTPPKHMVPTVGIEPTTARLQVECSTVEPRRHTKRHDTKIFMFFMSIIFTISKFKRTYLSETSKNFEVNYVSIVLFCSKI